jgi:hypothetical protein
MRIAMWASGSVLPARPESLEAILPLVQPALRPTVTITAKTVRSASLEESPPTHQSINRRRFKRRVFIEQPEIYDDASSFLDYQRRALSNRADLDDAGPSGEVTQPSFLGQPEHTKHSGNEDDAQPSLLARFFGALLPW